MPVEHVNITDPEIHEPKGVAAADLHHAYVADGAGSGSWQHPASHGGCYYNNIGTGTTITTPTAYTLVAPVTITTHLHEFTHNLLGRLTYTGIESRHGFFTVNISLKHSTGTGQDVFFAIYKNGSIETSAEYVRTADSANYGNISMMWDGPLTVNDYFEVYTKVSSGNVIIHSIGYHMTGALE